MANETDTTSYGSRIATEMIAEQAIAAHIARAVFLRLIHFDDSLNGARAAKKDYTSRGDGGAAAAGPGEATAHSGNTEITMGSAVSVTPTEAASSLSVISYDAMQQALGLTSQQLDGLIAADDAEMWAAVMRDDVQQLVARVVQKGEADALAELGNLTNTVGSSGSDVSIANLLTAVYTSNTLQPLRPAEERKFLLTPNQVHEVTVEALSTNGGLNGIWQGKQTTFTDAMGDEGVGYSGTFLGYAVHAYDHELRVLANMDADVVGCFGHLGVPGVAPDDPALGGRVGAFVFAERSPIQVQAKYDVDLRALKVQCGWRYDPALIDDSGAVGIVTDAPA